MNGSNALAPDRSSAINDRALSSKETRWKPIPNKPAWSTNAAATRPASEMR
jgi:hypothetical protein